jgi:hypothetical protein
MASPPHLLLTLLFYASFPTLWVASESLADSSSSRALEAASCESSCCTAAARCATKISSCDCRRMRNAASSARPDSATSSASCFAVSFACAAATVRARASSARRLKKKKKEKKRINLLTYCVFNLITHSIHTTILPTCFSLGRPG